MNGSGSKPMAATTVYRLAAATVALATVGLATTTPATATASPAGGRGQAAVPQTTARPFQESGLNAVSCTGPGSCVAVGFSMGPYSHGSLAARWDGTGWTQLPSPQGFATFPGITAVACGSDSMCMAVNGAVQEWNGSSWQLQATGGGVSFSAVSCTSAVNCVALGGRTAFVQGQYTVLPAAEQWNGQTWTEHDPVVPPGAGQTALDAISCVSASDCVAVGSYSANLAGNGAPLAEQWDGQSWSLLSVPAPPMTVLEVNLASVSCADADHCVAVGDVDVNGDDQGLAYAWDGTSWTALPQPIGIPGSVSCWSASGCVTTDQNSFDSGATAIPELWNGSSWAQLHPPLPNTTFSGFNGVSCYGPSACLLVGSASNSRPLAIVWTSGQWLTNRVVQRDGFAGIWCTGLFACVAAGGYIDSSDDNATLAANLSALGWQQATTPAVSGTLTDVSCDSPRFCMAVGGRGSNDLPLAEKWDGHGWQVLDTSFGDKIPGTQPFAVSCAGGDCLAVTKNYAANRYAEWWNGSSWRLIRKVPTPSRHFLAQLTDVSCVRATYCLVAGAQRHLNGHPLTSFVDLWNGTSLRLLSAPGNGLTSISCLSTTFCLGVTTNEALTWNGSSWRVRRLPGVFGRPGLVAVSCASARLCMAVGNYVGEQTFGNTIALLTGTTWRILPALPNGVVLTDVSCTSRASQCFLVGEQYDGAAATQTFTASWTGRDWLVYPAPNP